MSAVIDIKKLYFRYQHQKRWALENINLEVQKGRVLGVLGPGGSGKSSFCHLLNGLIPHAINGELKGEVIILDKNIQHYRVQTLSKSVGRVLQDVEMQIIGRRVYEDVAFGLQNFLVPSQEIKRRVPDILHSLGLKELADRPCDELSGGEKQRLAIAGIWVTEPEILVLDDPFSELDILGKKSLSQRLFQLKSSGNKTIVLVARELKEIQDLVDELIILDQGQIQWQGKPTCYPLAVNSSDNRETPAHWQDIEFEETGGVSRFFKAVFKIKNLSFSYHPLSPVLRNIHLQFYPRECIGILGPNGAGKTSLAKHLNGLVQAKPNTIFFKGQSIENIPPKDLRRSVAFVFQNPDHQLFENSVEEELIFGLKAHSINKQAINQRVNDILQITGLSNYRHDHPFSLSRTMRQVLAIACVTILEPEVLVVDEPTAGLDPTAASLVMKLLKSCWDKGSTLIMISHDITMIQNNCSRIITLLDGEIVVDCRVSQWEKDPSLRVRSGLFADERPLLGGVYDNG